LFGYIGIVVAAALANVIGGIAVVFAVGKTELLSLGLSRSSNTKKTRLT
jgi:hypothetical protein